MIVPSLAIVLNRKNTKSKSGLYSIHLRITIDRESKYFKIEVPQKISYKDWNGTDDQWVKNSHPFAFEINNKIIEKKNLIHDLIKRSYNFNKRLSFETIFQHLQKKGDRNSFLDYMDGYIKRPPEMLEENTLKKYRTTLTHLRKFRNQIYFSDVDNLLMRDFYRFMQTERTLQGAACKKYMEAFKKVIRQARKDNYIDPTQMEFLFDDLKIRVPKAKRTFLDISEIKQWKSVKLPAEKEFLARDRDLFLFQIYTGYYYKDLFIFTKDQLIEDQQYGLMIVGARDKNGNQTIIPLFKFPYAVNIIRKYRSDAKAKTVFNTSIFVEEPVYNRNLKEIAGLAKFTKSISNKVARHTNAQLWVRYGAEGAILSKMMGHTNEATTKNYYDVNLPEIVEGTKRADFKKLGI
jgi:site-specific recombinase XerD